MSLINWLLTQIERVKYSNIISLLKIFKRPKLANQFISNLVTASNVASEVNPIIGVVIY